MEDLFIILTFFVLSTPSNIMDGLSVISPGLPINAVVHDLGLHTVMKKEVIGVTVLLRSVGAAGV